MPGSWRSCGIRAAKSEEEIADQLSGHWRADHLFTLQEGLKMYDAIKKRITGQPEKSHPIHAQLRAEHEITHAIPRRAIGRSAGSSRSAFGAAYDRPALRKLGDDSARSDAE
jgi:predicted small metal-binding protein